MKLDILVIAPHPDDAELGCGGTLIKHAEMGYKTGIIDLTEGELGTRGTPELRLKEAQKASRILGLSVRENMGFRDGWFIDDEKHRLALIQKIRQYQPEIVITSAPEDRHPDHGRAAKLVKESSWLAGLEKIKTKDTKGKVQKAWRPKHLFHFIQYIPHEPDFVVEIGDYIQKKMKAVMCYSSQFYNPHSHESPTLISSPEFPDQIKARMKRDGNYALIDYAEGFISAYKPALNSLFDLK